jgi:hypothetical protein
MRDRFGHRNPELEGVLKAGLQRIFHDVRVNGRLMMVTGDSRISQGNILAEKSRLAQDATGATHRRRSDQAR